MKKLQPEIIVFYDQKVVQMIAEKYACSLLDALRLFVQSKTHELLEDENCGMAAFGAGAVFEIWETERATGDPRNSIYIQGE